jgi:sterol desaturase/sphingolipid hydroxylase (fatty acid hydroxylase superfamily)
MTPQLILYAVPFFLITLLVESYISYRMQREFVERKDSLTSIGLGLGNLAVGTLTKSMAIVTYFYVYDHFRLADLDSSWWMVWVFAFFADDLTYYWFHRISHEVRIFWASHIVHHSSPNYNLAAALRQTWTSQLTLTFMFYIWIPLLGVHPFIVFFFQQTSLLYQYWIHTEFIQKMPKWFEYVMNTPSHHRVHHGIDVEYLDTNYAGVMIIWDRIFGSFKAEGARPHYGLTKQIESYNPVKIAFYEWVQIVKDLRHTKNLRNIWGYLMGPPGWSHDGSRMTVAQMRAEIQKQTQNTGKDGIEN